MEWIILHLGWGFIFGSLPAIALYSYLLEPYFLRWKTAGQNPPLPIMRKFAFWTVVGCALIFFGVLPLASHWTQLIVVASFCITISLLFTAHRKAQDFSIQDKSR